MIRKALLASMLIAAMAGASGCGTIMAFMDHPEVRPRLGSQAPHVYGGVRLDYSIVFNPDHGWMPFLILDIPLSFVMDTVLLPVTVPWVLFFKREDETRSPQ